MKYNINHPVHYRIKAEKGKDKLIYFLPDCYLVMNVQALGSFRRTDKSTSFEWAHSGGLRNENTGSQVALKRYGKDKGLDIFNFPWPMCCKEEDAGDCWKVAGMIYECISYFKKEETHEDGSTMHYYWAILDAEKVKMELLSDS